MGTGRLASWLLPAVINLSLMLAHAPVRAVETSSPEWRHGKGETAFDTAQESRALTRDFGFGVGYTPPYQLVAEVYGETGVRWAKTAGIYWDRIEPNPPDEEGRHTYKWEELDRAVRVWQEAGIENLQLWLKCANGWATQPTKGDPRRVSLTRAASMLPDNERWDDYVAFVSSVVERYDDDGIDDMPGLSYPVLHYEIESEAQHPGQWQGTLDEYIKLLETAHHAAKDANPDVKIIPSGFTFLGLMDDIPSAEMLAERLEAYPNIKRHFEFNSAILARPDLFDEVEFHLLTDYKAVYATVDWIRREMRRHGY